MSNEDTDTKVIREELARLARARGLTSPQPLGRLVGLHHRSGRLFEILDQISVCEHENGRPLLSVLVVSVDRNSSGTGFFSAARRLNRMGRDDREWDFWLSERDRVYDFWERQDDG